MYLKDLLERNMYASDLVLQLRITNLIKIKSLLLTKIDISYRKVYNKAPKILIPVQNKTILLLFKHCHQK